MCMCAFQHNSVKKGIKKNNNSKHKLISSDNIRSKFMSECKYQDTYHLVGHAFSLQKQN